MSHYNTRPSWRTRRPRAERGFTLIELLLVLVILGILAGLVIPRFTGTTEKGRATAALTQIGSFKTALRSFELACGRFPTTEEGLKALVEQPANVKGWSGSYLEEGVPKDPWGNDYVYRRPGQNGTDYDVFSCGPDGQPGNDDDVTSWTKK